MILKNGSRPETLFSIICALAVMLSAASFDLYLWSKNDRFKEPIRAAVLNDQEYYMARLHRALVAGHPVNSPYYVEHEDGPSRYFMFEALATTAAKVFKSTNASAWAAFLRPLTALWLYLLYRHVLRRWAHIGEWMAAAFASGIVLWQYVQSLAGGAALLSWYAPFMLFGIIATVRSLTASTREAAGLWSIVSVASFAFHPVSFAAGILASGLCWMKRLYQERTSDALLRCSVFGCAVVAFGVLCFAGIIGGPGTGPAAVAALERTPKIASRLPPYPLDTLRLLCAAALTYLVALKVSEERLRVATETVAAFLLATAVGSWSNFVTGNFFLNSHFTFIAAFTLPIAAALSLRAEKGPTRLGTLVAWTSIAAVAIHAGTQMYERPVRSWLVLGTYVPECLSLLVLAWSALGRSWPRRPAWFTGSRAAIGLLFASAAYAGVFQWRNDRSYLSIHADAQDARGVLRALAALPPGAVMADHDASGLISFQAPQHLYWYYWASIDEATQDELYARWKDMLVLYPEAPELRDSLAWRGLFDLLDVMCDAPSERLIYGPLRQIGVLDKTLCQKPGWRADREAFIRRGVQDADALRRPSWKPAFRADYALFDKKKNEFPPAAISKKLQPIFEDGRYILYQF